MRITSLSIALYASFLQVSSAFLVSYGVHTRRLAFVTLEAGPQGEEEKPWISEMSETGTNHIDVVLGSNADENEANKSRAHWKYR